MLRLGIDTGGTFTDVVARDEDTGAQWTTKVPSTPSDPSLAFMAGVAHILELQTRAAAEVASLAHGTTVATNALLSEEGSFPGLGLIVTRGFRHILEIARQSVPQGYGNSYFWVKPERIVPLQRVCEVGERIDFRGSVLQPLDAAEAESAARFFREQNIDCIGVCFLHAYANGAHERQMRDILRAVYPAAQVSISSEVLPEYREYERTVTTLVDAFVKPRIARYVEQISTRLAAEVRPRAPFYIMKSNGGVVSAREVARQPIATVLSGPAAGALGAAFLAQAAGFPRALTLDGGGTSTDVALVDNGVPHVTTEGRIGQHPIKVPMIDIVTVGAGGGSIARRAPDGRLKVGPESAGAEPGPMCYGQGGQQPTITDAALVLGHLPAHLLGGEIALARDTAAAGLRDLAQALGMDTYGVAAGILELAAWSQANAVRQATVRRGLDVRDYALVAFGGSGPLQAARLVDVLGMQAALIPPSPGNVSALGLLTVDLKVDYVATAVQRHATVNLEQLRGVLDRLEAHARAALEREGFSASEMTLVRSADLRYFGQAWEVRVEVPAGTLDARAAETVVERFHAAHERTYGYSYHHAQPPQEIEWINLRVTGIGPIRRPAIARLEARAAGKPEPSGARAAYFDGRLTETPTYARQTLLGEDCLEGPCIVEEFGSTTIVPPGMRASVDAYGNLIVARRA